MTAEHEAERAEDDDEPPRLSLQSRRLARSARKRLPDLAQLAAHAGRDDFRKAITANDERARIEVRQVVAARGTAGGGSADVHAHSPETILS